MCISSTVWGGGVKKALLKPIGIQWLTFSRGTELLTNKVARTKILKNYSKKM